MDALAEEVLDAAATLLGRGKAPPHTLSFVHTSRANGSVLGRRKHHEILSRTFEESRRNIADRLPEQWHLWATGIS